MSDKRIGALDVTLGRRHAAFERGLEALLAFVTEHGHANVPFDHITADGFRLGSWLRSRRRDYRLGKLSQERIAKLEALGVAWHAYDFAFERGLEALRAFVAEHGNAHVPSHHVTTEGLRLGTWLNTRRQDYKLGKLSQERIAKLEALGVAWHTYDFAFERGLEALRGFVAEHGNAHVSRHHVTLNGFQLGSWLNTRRQDYKLGKLSQERIARLEALGVVWDQRYVAFKHGLETLRAFVAEHGHANVPFDHITADGFRLGLWLNTRRHDHRVGRLSQERIDQLEALGVVWDLFDFAFERGLEALRAFVAEHGNAQVPRHYVTTDGFLLWLWLCRRRHEYRVGKLSQERIAKLEALGVAWHAYDFAFERGLEALRAFVAEHGHANVPSNHITSAGFRLGTWLCSRRNDYRVGKLSQERIAKLEALGVRWRVR